MDVNPQQVGSTRRFAATFGVATIVGQLAQVAWLAAGSRTMNRAELGSVLAAQALYGVLQFVMDYGSALNGARLAAAGLLSPEARASIVRARLIVAGVATAPLLAIGAVGGAQSVLASAPFMPALVLFALFTYWEPFGRGHSGPWAAYLVLRPSLPALVAIGCLLLSVGFPLILAGFAECAAIVLAAAAFRLGLVSKLREAARAPTGDWTSIRALGVPSLSWPVGLSAGPVVLNAFGAPAAAAVTAVSLRLVTGVTQIASIAATALFPRLAAPSVQDVRGMATAAFSALAAVTFAANGVLLLGTDLIISILLERSDRESEAAAIVALGAAAVVSYLLLLTSLLAARGLEQRLGAGWLVATGVTLAGSVAVAALEPARSAIWMVGVFAVAHLLGAWITAYRTERELGGPFLRFAVVGSAVLGLSALGASAQALRLPIGVLLLVVAAAIALRRGLGLRQRLRS